MAGPPPIAIGDFGRLVWGGSSHPHANGGGSATHYGVANHPYFLFFIFKLIILFFIYFLKY